MGALSFELDRWVYQATEDTITPVLPDGCRDLIIRSRPGDAPTLSVSALGHGAEYHPVDAGVHLSGVRLAPGAVIDEAGLRAWWARRPEMHLNASLVEEFVRLDGRLQEALGALAAHATENTAIASQALGVSLRTLQRLFRGARLPAPDFWRRLVRARRAGRAIGQEAERSKHPLPLARIAATHGYADQAHLSRAIRHWFGVTPSELRRTPQLTTMLNASGYD